MDAQSYHRDLEALAWQVELGADEAILDTPVNRYEAPAAQPRAEPEVVSPAPSAKVEADPAAEAAALAESAGDIGALEAAFRGYQGCELYRGARSFVFADGVPGARVMVVGDAPGRAEDQEGRPYAGREGALFDGMFGAIGLSRSENLYVSLTCPWRPPQDRAVTTPELALLKPFLFRHIELAAPEVLVLMGNTVCSALLSESGMGRLRGNWREALGRPAIAIYPPARLMETPALKREAWADLLMLKGKLTK